MEDEHEDDVTNDYGWYCEGCGDCEDCERQEEAKFKYLEIKARRNYNVIKRVDLTGQTDKVIDLIKAGINRNLDHSNYYTTICDSEIKLDVYQ